MIPYFDAHCDTALEVWRRSAALYENGLHLDLKRLSAYGPCAQVFSICADYGPGMSEQTDKTLDYLLRELDANSEIIRLCHSSVDIIQCAEAKKIAALISVEGAEKLDCSVARLREAHAKGLRIVHLCWNHDNALTGAAMDSGSGLTEQGRGFVSAAQEVGVVIDLSHLSERGFWDVLEIARKPVLAGHSSAAALCPHPRNLTDAQFTALVNAGGVAGLNFYPEFLGLTRDVGAIVAHAEHWLSLGGEKAVCLGGDLDGIETLPGGMTGVESVGALYDAMLRKNWSEDTVRDIFYNNLNDFFGRAL